MTKNENSRDLDGTQHDLRPIPDPTSLTTQQLDREISSLKELLFTRLEAMDRATQLLAENVHRVPTQTTTQVEHLKELVMMRFTERDLRADQSSCDTKEALSAARVSADRALVEAKEAINKRFDIAESQMHGLDERVRMLMPRSESEALHKAHTERVQQLAERMNLREERGKGMHQGWAAVVAGVSLIVTILSAVMLILSRGGS